MKTPRQLLLATLVTTSLGIVAMPALADPGDAAPDQQTAHFDGDRGGPPKGMRGGPHGPGRGGPPGMMAHWKGAPGGPRFGGPMGGPGGPGGMAMDVIIERFDANGDGQITKEEVATVNADKLKQFDANGDGQLSLDEYKALWADQMDRMIVRSFQMHDPDGNAQVTIEEYSERSDRLFDRFDRNGDGTIDKAEFAPPRGGDRPDGPPPPPPGNGPHGDPGAPDEGPGEPG